MAGEAGAALLVEIAKKAVQPAIDATVLHCGYLFNFKSNIDNLKQSAKDLKSKRLDAENFLNSFGDNNEETTNTSKDWLLKSKAAEDTANGIEKDTQNLKMVCCCPNPIKRYQLSKKAVAEAKEIQQLQIQGRGYVPLSNPALPPSKLTGSMSNDLSREYKSRAKIMDEIMEALKDDKISIVGVCGPGGVGKTTLMHELRERAKLDGLFNEVSMAAVSQTPDLSNIQCKLAEMLGLTSVKDGKNEIATADAIHKRLTGKDRRTLVILDDMWSEINLKELGIPIGSNQTQCKVVFTSRNSDICTQMKAQKKVVVEIMPPAEAWYLFRETAGDFLEGDDLKNVAQEVANECGGLPIALVTVAGALSKKAIEIWQDALKQLREHSLRTIAGMENKVYSSIKLSYDFLASEVPEAKLLILLCCQHPEDAQIQVELLVRYCLALRLFKNVDTLYDARNRVTSLIEHLKGRFLLEVADVDDYEKKLGGVRVKMHDIVRDVGRSIISSSNEGERIMQIVKQKINDGYEVVNSEADYKNLKILVLKFGVDGGSMEKSFLSNMEELRVLEYYPEGLPDLFEIKQLESEVVVEVLTNLRMLSIQRVYLGEDFWSKIGTLTKLEILGFIDCYGVGQIPHQIKQLSHLKLLDLRVSNFTLHPISRGILSTLKKLEMLYLGSYYFLGSPGDGEQLNEGESHACISELSSLPNLMALQVRLLNPMQLLDLPLEKLEIFSFNNVREQPLYVRPIDGNMLVFRKLKIVGFSMDLIFGDKIQCILRRTENLVLKEIDWIDPLIMEKLVSVRELKMKECRNLEYLVGATSVGVFTKLEYLRLWYMNNLTALCQNSNLLVGTFGNLRMMYLSNLPKLRHLWVGPTDTFCLAQLQELVVDKCEMLEGIVSKGDVDAITGKVGEIIQEPTNFILHFPKLREVRIRGSSKFGGFYRFYDQGSRIQPVVSPLVMLPSLETLAVSKLHQQKQIVGYGNIDSPVLVACDWLQNLGLVYVTSCDSLESVFDFEGIQLLSENINGVTLGKLRKIQLRKLFNLTCIFRCRMQDISIPRLQDIEIYKCGKLENLVASNLIKLLHSLKQVKIKECEKIEAVFDFNGFDAMNDNARVILGGLQVIELDNLPKLVHVCRLPPKGTHAFQSLRELSVHNCASLSYLLSSSMAKSLGNLELLKIMLCESMDECIRMDGKHLEEKIVPTLLPNLQTSACVPTLLPTNIQPSTPTHPTASSFEISQLLAAVRAMSHQQIASQLQISQLITSQQALQAQLSRLLHTQVSGVQSQMDNVQTLLVDTTKGEDTVNKAYEEEVIDVIKSDLHEIKEKVCVTTAQFESHGSRLESIDAHLAAIRSLIDTVVEEFKSKQKFKMTEYPTSE